VTARFFTTASTFGLAFAALMPAAAFAQDAEAAIAAAETGSAEIVVTAQRREERQVDVPITVASLSAAQLETANVEQLADISKITPGVRFDYAGGFYQPTVRGIGTAVTTSGGGGNVGIYIDGFYSPNPLATNSQLMNVQSIQVLKGPQGTLFGRNTTGGAILINSADPSVLPAAEVKFSYGRYNELEAQAYATMGISENVAIDVEGLYARGDGWQRDISNGGRRVGDYENWSVRLGLKAFFGDNVSLLLRYQHSETNDPRPLLVSSYFNPNPTALDPVSQGQPFYAAPGQFTYDPDEIASGPVPEFMRTRSDVIQGTIKADLGFADLTSYTQYRKEVVDASLELDFSAAINTLSPGPEVFQLGLPNDNYTFTQEMLFTSKPGNRLQWTAGLFYLENRDTYVTHIDNFVGTPVGRIRLGGSSTTTKSYAAFVDATYEITPQLFLTAGARYAHDVVDNAYWNTRFLAPTYEKNGQPLPAPNGQVFVPGISSDRVTPRAVIRYKPNDRSSIYASYTRGYKAAIIAVGGTCQNAPDYECNDVRPEVIDAFEIGYKYDDRALSFELAAFYYDYKDLQVSLFEAGTAKIVNAAKSRIYGLDGQIRYRFSEAFEVNAGAAWTHARYVEFTNAPIYVPCPSVAPAATCQAPAPAGFGGISFLVIGQNLSDVTMQRTPEFTGNIGARYRTDLGGGQLILSGNLYYSSSFFFGPSGVQFPQEGYETLSLRAEWRDPSDRFSIAAYGDNVTNNRYLTQVQYNNFSIGSNWSQPATFGIELGARF
jgi:iron complex outermembrane recepter protein